MAKKNTTKIDHEILDKGTEFAAGKERTFILQKQIGKGGFGIIYSANKKGEPNSLYAVKTEPKGNGPLFVEIAVLRKLAKESDISSYKKSKKLSHLGIPLFMGMGFHSNTRFLIIPFYKTSLEAGIIEKKLTPANVITMCEQMTDALEYIHSMKYVHSDLKSENILTNDFTKFYLVDYGIASPYYIKDAHVVEKPDKKLMNNGTLEYTSLDSHIGLPLSRRSDFQEFTINIFSWTCRLLVEAKRKNFHNSLPWGEMISKQGKDKNIYDKVKKVKETSFEKPETWCTALGIPKMPSLIEIANYSYKIGYSEDPDYVKFKSWIKKIDLGKTAAPKKPTAKPQVQTTPQVRTSIRNRARLECNDSDASFSHSSGENKPGRKRGKLNASSQNNVSSEENKKNDSSSFAKRKIKELGLRKDGEPVVLNYHIEAVLKKATRSSPRKVQKSSTTIATQTSPDLLRKYKTQLKLQKNT